jgi:hypothetical protein
MSNMPPQDGSTSANVICFRQKREYACFLFITTRRLSQTSMQALYQVFYRAWRAIVF